MTFELVTTANDLQGVVDELIDEPRYAVDTEFHRERTYFPKVALVQLAWPGRTVLVDPLAVSLEPLSKVLQGTGLAVLHASRSSALTVCEPSRLIRRAATRPVRCFMRALYPALEESGQKRRRAFRNPDDLVGCLAIELEVEFGLGAAMGRLRSCSRK